MSDIFIEREVGLRTSDLVAYQRQDRCFVVQLRRPDDYRCSRWWDRHSQRGERRLFVEGQDESRFVCADEAEAVALLCTMQREMNRELRTGEGR